jgi:glyoxylase-like metal-dependent hydrolase (beta-lactamase superfamily II)
MKIRKILLWTLAVLAVIVVFGMVYLYPTYRFFFSKEVIKVDDNLTVVKGGGGNSGILVGTGGVLVIDTKMGSDAEDLYKMAREKAGGKKIIVINTHYHGDHVRGNHLYSGCPIYIGAYDPLFLQQGISKENMPDHFVKDSLTISLGNEEAVLYAMGQAHTFDDMVVLLRNRKLLFTGDLVFNKVNPVLKKESGANVGKWVSVLDRILCNPDVEKIVPGHGDMGGRDLAEAIRTYFVDMSTAATYPSKADSLKAKYRDWTVMPMMASPSATIDFIKSSK